MQRSADLVIGGLIIITHSLLSYLGLVLFYYVDSFEVPQKLENGKGCGYETEIILWLYIYKLSCKILVGRCIIYLIVAMMHLLSLMGRHSREVLGPLFYLLSKFVDSIGRYAILFHICVMASGVLILPMPMLHYCDWFFTKALCINASIVMILLGCWSHPRL